jgi:hypothetical protein
VVATNFIPPRIAKGLKREERKRTSIASSIVKRDHGENQEFQKRLSLYVSVY